MFKYHKNGISIITILDRRRPKKNGLFPVKIEVIFHSEQKYFPVRIDMSEEEWENADSQSDKLTDIGMYFRHIVNLTASLVSEGRFSIATLSAHIASPKIITINKILESMSENFLNEGRVNSYYRCRSTLRNLEKFAGSDIYPYEITAAWLEKCESYWIDEGKSYTTVNIYMKTLKSAINIAIQKGYMRDSSSPFGKGCYVIPEGVIRKLALSKVQIRKIMEFKGNEKLEEYRDLWLFSYLCNGINFKDMLLLKYKNIMNGEICFIRSKTRHAYRRPKIVRAILTHEMSDIISRWGNRYDGNPNCYIFRFANGVEGEMEISNMVRKVIMACNSALEQIAETLGIPKFTTYSARHSFATVLMKSGVSINYISESLGHSSLAITENYLAGFDHEERMDRAALLTAF